MPVPVRVAHFAVGVFEDVGAVAAVFGLRGAQVQAHVGDLRRIGGHATERPHVGRCAGAVAAEGGWAFEAGLRAAWDGPVAAGEFEAGEFAAGGVLAGGDAGTDFGGRFEGVFFHDSAEAFGEGAGCVGARAGAAAGEGVAG